jgi:hypothetical protein
MNTPRVLAAATLALLAAVVHAAPGQDADPDGAAKPHKKPTLASTAGGQLRAADVPSVSTDPGSLKAKADADIASRDARARSPRLVVQRQNLKGDDARRALAQRATPNSIDRATAYGDKDHTEQVTDLKITLQK